MIAVALAVAGTSVAGYVTLRYSLYRALDQEMVETASSLAVPTAQDIRSLNGLTERALRAGNISAAAVRSDGTIFYVPDERAHLVLGEDEIAIAKLQQGYSARSGYATDGQPYRIVAVPITELGNYAMVLGRPLAATNRILSSLWLVLIVFGGAGVGAGRRGGRDRRPLQHASRSRAVGRGRAHRSHRRAGDRSR